MTEGPFALQEPFHSTRTNCGTTHFLHFRTAETGCDFSNGLPFLRTKLAPTPGQGVTSITGTTHDVSRR